MKKAKPLLHDHLITIRVKKYLEEHIGETYLDVKQMTRELMQKYPEYSRRKFGPFRQLVHQAFSIISDSYNLDKVSSSEDDCISEEFEAPPTNSVMSNMMNSLYSQSVPRKSLAAKPISEPIDISSGDDNDDDTNTNTTNGDGPTAPAPPAVQPNALKRLMEDLPETTAAPKKSKQNTHHGAGSEAAHKFPAGSCPRGKNHSEDAGQRKDNRNASSLYQQLHPNQNRDRPRKYKKELEVQHTTESFRDIGGMDSTLKELCEMLIHIKSPEFYFQLGLLPSRGLLLHGPPGCGKTFLARAISGQLKMPLLEVPATELIGGISGESEERIREVFEQAIGYSPCVLFIDEIDAIGGNRQWASKDMERRIVSQLISSLDNLKANEFGQSVVVIAATTRPDVLDPGLRRIGRFDHEIAIHIPSRKERREILRIQCEGLSIDPKLNYDKIAELTPGYVGADLMALVSRAASVAVKRRSMKKFRELHAASEKNMTTVTLDDDEPIEESSDKVEKEKEAEPKSEKEAEKKGETKEKADGDNVTTDKQKSEGDASKTESPKKATNGKSPEKPTDAAMEVDEEAAKEPEKPAEQIADSSSDEYYEPTLAELTNFLDNPPEEFADPNFCLTLIDFVDAIKVMQPSAKREGFVTVPDTTWDDIGALEKIREELKLAVLAPVKYPEMLERLGLTAPSGVLLCGPPGCGKTLLAKAIANEAGINFISVKGPELMNMYVGESERAVRACFQRARNSAPCVIFFDEFDSLCPKRSDGGDGNNSGTRIVNQLLTEMDGVEERKGVYILAATNRPDIIDPAILRPGRLDTILYVGMPEQSERAEILKATTKNGKRPVLAEDVNLDEIAAQTEGYTGADLAGLVKQASMFSLRQSLNNGDTKLDDLCVRSQHFKEALQQLRPSVNEQDRKIYDKLRLKYAAPRVPAFDDK
ncbi:nuclear valosin-containing protein-like isoform X2 [Drosophila biarmipes]|uniref:nuclear valosin-containing protein-like isoform X2 n=1 Tax=Drosophila biarmipes TaxID=125945 RepID=UPI0007E6693D|nr:nuclear valosin-containing protein-like isoform X2 [Drosophila biarmipes]